MKTILKTIVSVASQIAKKKNPSNCLVIFDLKRAPNLNSCTMYILGWWRAIQLLLRYSKDQNVHNYFAWRR